MAKDLITIEHTKLAYRNFSGKRDQSGQGKRDFGVIIPTQEMADELEEAGFNVKYLKPRHDEDIPIPYVKVKINMNYKYRPPRVFTDIDGEKNELFEDTISSLDYADIKEVSMQLSYRNWEVGNKSGKVLDLVNLVCFLSEDDFLSRYDLNDIN